MRILKYIKKGIKEFRREWKNSEWWQFRLPSLIIRAIYPLFKRKNEGIFVMKEDWDNLIILDACSYEVFAEINWLKGKLEKKISRGSHTWMFLEENFRDFYPDTVYISANPFIWEFRDSFYQTIYVDTISPEIFLEYALKTNALYPDKRLIVHFLQPHHPFIGKTKIEKVRDNKNPYYLFAKGEIKESTIRQAYKDNLRAVLPSVERLVSKLVGKTVITADHGEAFGAKIPFWPIRIYGHSGPRIKELIEVPWLIIYKTPRKKIVRGEKRQKPLIITGEEIEKNMHNNILGYF